MEQFFLDLALTRGNVEWQLILCGNRFIIRSVPRNDTPRPSGQSILAARPSNDILTAARCRMCPLQAVIELRGIPMVAGGVFAYGPALGLYEYQLYRIIAAADYSLEKGYFDLTLRNRLVETLKLSEVD